MNNPSSNAIAIEVALERLRQERETFQQRRNQEERWFSLRLRMGYTAVVLLPTIAGISGFVVYNHVWFSTATVTAASGALFVDVLGLMAAVWKVVLNPDSVTKLGPVTGNLDLSSLPNPSSDQQS